jgi:hypothetical protein
MCYLLYIQMTTLKHKVVYIAPVGRCVISPPFPEYSTDSTALMKIGIDIDLIAEDAAYDYFHSDDTVISTKFACIDNFLTNNKITYSRCPLFSILRNRMAFWTKPTNQYITFEKVNTISPETVKETRRRCKQLAVRIADNRGIDLDRLLVRTHECKDCGETATSVKKSMKMTGSYALRLLAYLQETFNMFYSVNFEHNDVSISNLVVQPSTEELKSGYLTTSLPVIIDFGLSKIHIIPLPKDPTPTIMRDLLSTCRHGHRWLMTTARGSDTNEPCWVLQAMDIDDPKYANVVVAINEYVGINV